MVVKGVGWWRGTSWEFGISRWKHAFIYRMDKQGSTVERRELCSISSVQLLSHVRLFATPWTAERQASLSIINSQNLLTLMPSNHLIICHPLLLLPSIFPSIRVFSNESILCIRWPKYWSFSFSISPSSQYSGPISFRIEWVDLLAVQGSHFVFAYLSL